MAQSWLKYGPPKIRFGIIGLGLVRLLKKSPQLKPNNVVVLILWMSNFACGINLITLASDFVYL